MPLHVVIDGNNLLFAMHEHAPLPNIGRDTLVRTVERWARQGADDVTLVFDGPEPRGGLAAQLASPRIRVRFSAPQTADDVIVSYIQRARDAGTVRVISSDSALRHEAHRRRCRHTDSAAFVAELFARPGTVASPGGPDEKPGEPTTDESQEWLRAFGVEGDDPFDGFDAMQR
ncbi:MAG: NYN domain-containing protein [Planctomycetes bacterium]|nr:NYN domain-containing protein [Planctomycetota bacterium]